MILQRADSCQILLASGWRHGDGLGGTRQGLTEPVAVEMDESQTKQRAGFGFSGTPYAHPGVAKKATRHTISTVFDDRDVNDPQAPAWRRREENVHLTYR